MVPVLMDEEEGDRWMQVEYLCEDREVDPNEEAKGPYDRSEASIFIEPMRAGSEYTVSC